MEDQIAAIASLGISAVHVSERQSTDSTTKHGIRHGNFQILFFSRKLSSAVQSGGDYCQLITTNSTWLIWLSMKLTV